MNALTDHHVYAIAAMAVAIAAVVAGIRALRKSTNRPPAAVIVTAIAAAACTAYSAGTSWGFARDHLGMSNGAERGAMFAAAELALFSVALMARQNLTDHGAPGTPGVLVWVITGVQVVPAFSESGMVGGFVRAFVGPVLAALLWHLAMGIELRHAKPGASNQALWAILVREARERVMSRFGLAVRDRTAEQITRDRWTQRAVGLAARLSEFSPKPTGRLNKRRATRLAHRLSVAVGRAQVGADSGQRHMLLSLLAARRHAPQLATMNLGSPWVDPHAQQRPRVVICQGPHGIRIPYPTPRPAVAPSELAGPAGDRIEDVAELFKGVHAPVVYFIQNGNRVKIGTSTNLRRRVARLSLPTQSIILVLHGDVVYERELHGRFAEYRTPGTEWFDYVNPIANFVASGGKTTDPPAPGDDGANVSPPLSPAPGGAHGEPPASASTPPASTANWRQDSPGATASPTPAVRQRTPRAGAKKPGNTRRSMDDWVQLAGPIFHAEFARLRRNPTGSEFADAIRKAGLGTVSDSTAKNIRAEILDRTDLPELA